MTATDYQIDLLDRYLDLADLVPGVTIAAAARRLQCNEDTLRRAITVAREAGDTRAPAPERAPRQPEQPTAREEETARRKTWTPLRGDPRLMRAAAWTCAHQADNADELGMFLSQLGLTAKDARP